MFRTGILLILGATLAACGGPEGRANWYLEQAQEALDEGDWLKAEMDLLYALENDPENVAALEMVYKIAEELELWSEMFRALKELVAVDENNVEARVRLGRLLLMGQNTGDAAAMADEALRLEPEDHGARVLHASVLYATGDRETGLSQAHAVLDEDPTSVEAAVFLASAYTAEDPDRALAILERAIDAYPDDEMLSDLRMHALAGKERGGTRKCYESIKLQPNDPANQPEAI